MGLSPTQDSTFFPLCGRNKNYLCLIITTLLTLHLVEVLCCVCVAGERRIRVHTICLPVSSQPSVLYSKLNVAAITGVLANMGEASSSSSS